MREVCPTAAAACLRATVRGRSVIPSFSRPAAIAPEVTTTNETPSAERASTIWAASARIVDMRSPAPGSVTVPLPILTTTRRTRGNDTISRERFPAFRSSDMRLPPPKGQQSVEQGRDPLPGDRGDAVDIPRGVPDLLHRALRVFPGSRQVHLGEHEQGGTGGEFGTELFHLRPDGAVCRDDPVGILRGVDHVHRPPRARPPRHGASPRGA